MVPGPVRVEVTAEDIRDGKPCQPRGCAVALAARRALGIQPLGDDDLVVSAQGVALERGGRWYHAFSPGLNDFTYRYDHYEHVDPIVFDFHFE